MTILLLADHDGNDLQEATARALSAARDIGGEVHVLVAGKDVNNVAAEASRLNGVDKVLVADSPALANGLAEPLTDLLFALSSNYDVLMTSSTSCGKNVMPRVAAILDVMQVSDITAVVSSNTFERPIYAGNAVQTVQVTDPKLVLTIRSAAFSAQEANGSAPIENIECPTSSVTSVFLGASFAKSERPEMTSAKIVVSGGRALGSAESFQNIVLPLADQLGAAVGASRAAVDSGFAPNDWQVGQTGKVVAPELYVALGISGAIQHLAGMKDSKIIVAINSDPDAPIFQVADYGLIGDLFELAPALTKEIERIKSQIASSSV